jgi:hypothetical protein
MSEINLSAAAATIGAAVFPTILLPIHLTILLAILLPVHLTVLLPVFASIFPTIILPVFPAVLLPILLPIRAPIFLANIGLCRGEVGVQDPGHRQSREDGETHQNAGFHNGGWLHKKSSVRA